MGRAFWEEMSRLAVTHPIVIDRPKGKPHPNWVELVYPLDYGYLEGTSASDGSGIDVWIGSLGGVSLTGILCTYDTFKRDAEIKLLLGCTPEDVKTILAFHDEIMRVLYIPRPKETE
jgi:inorganic pyrophosphatase